MQKTVQSNNVKKNHESTNLRALNETIKDLKKRVSEDPDPFLVELISKLYVVQRNQQSFLVQKAVRTEQKIRGGFKGFGTS
jgi:uncharacterized protein YcbK (DUF882 family)